MSCGVPLTPDAKVTIDELTTEIEAHPLYKHIMEQVEQMMLTPAANNIGTGAR